MVRAVAVVLVAVREAGVTEAVAVAGEVMAEGAMVAAATAAAKAVATAVAARVGGDAALAVADMAVGMAPGSLVEVVGAAIDKTRRLEAAGTQLP